MVLFAGRHELDNPMEQLPRTYDNVQGRQWVRVGIWTMSNGTYLEMISYHPNRHLRKVQKQMQK